VFAESYEWQVEWDRRIKVYEDKLQAVYRSRAACQKLGTIPGVGPLIATAMVAALGDGQAFKSGRQVSAWLGILPKQDSSGGKPKLLGISKRGAASGSEPIDSVLFWCIILPSCGACEASQAPGGPAAGVPRSPAPLRSFRQAFATDRYRLPLVEQRRLPSARASPGTLDSLLGRGDGAASPGARNGATGFRP